MRTQNIYIKDCNVPTLNAALHPFQLEQLAINEGIDVEFKGGKKLVHLNDKHEKGVDTSVKHNPSAIQLSIDEKNFDIKEVPVYSIFKRVSGNPGDGNSLIFAMKEENNYMFGTGEKQKFQNRAKQIIYKFLETYMSSINSGFSTIVLPSGKSVNSEFAQLVKRIADKHWKGKTQLYDDVFVKLPVDFVRTSVLYDAGSAYNEWVHQFPEQTIGQISAEFEKNLDMMDEKRRGYFTYHMVTNPDVRNLISTSLSINQDYKPYADAFSPINDKDILMLDDLMSRGNTIKDAIRNLCNSYHPKSVTVLTLLSSKY